jgi:hypothetical protein
MEINVEKTKVMRISKQPSPIKTVIDQKQLENVDYCNYLGSTITNDARCTREIKSRIAMAKAAFNKKTLFTSKMDFNLRKKLVKCCIWSIALYGAETCTLRKTDQKFTLKIVKYGAGEGRRREPAGTYTEWDTQVSGLH